MDDDDRLYRQSTQQMLADEERERYNNLVGVQNRLIEADWQKKANLEKYHGRGKAAKKYITAPVKTPIEKYNKKTAMNQKIERFNATHANKIERVADSYKTFKNLTGNMTKKRFEQEFK